MVILPAPFLTGSESAVADEPTEGSDLVGKDLSFQRFTNPFER